MDSGVNLTEPIDSGALDSDEDFDDDDDDNKKSKEKKSVSSALDSGLQLDDSFSGLSIKNDLSSTASDRRTEPEPEPAPWQIYFRQDDEGDTQLHVAIINKLPDAVTALLQMCPHPILLDIFNDVRQAPIHLAVLTKQYTIIRRLLIAGANINSRDANGNTALHLACMAGDFQSFTALTTPLPQNSQASMIKPLPLALDQVNYDGQTCVHLAALGGHIDILRNLVWFGANINARENKSGRTALHLAIENRNIELLEYLIQCPKISMNARTYSGHTAFQLCVGSIREQLLAAGYRRQEDESDIESDEDDDDDEFQFRQNNYFNSTSIRNAEAINVA